MPVVNKDQPSLVAAELGANADHQPDLEVVMPLLRERVGAVNWRTAAIFALAVCIGASARAATPFDQLLGSWSGSGQIRYASGDSEAVRCTAYYTGGGARLRLAIRCKSASNDIEIRGQLGLQGDKVSGTWEERTFNASGDASGRVAGGRLNLSITGGGFSGSMAVSYDGSRQTVTIATQGIPMKSVNVTMGKS